MNPTISEFKSLFIESFYEPTYDKWRVKQEKAGKDIVGEEYESFRKKYYAKKGLNPIKGKRVFGDLNPDIVVYKGDEVVLIEECKGHYIDKCFLERAIGDAVSIFEWCVENNNPVPYYVLSCATNLSSFQTIFDSRLKIYRKDLSNLLREKFKFLPLCEHGRVGEKSYFKSKESCFSINEKLIENQELFIDSIIQ